MAAVVWTARVLDNRELKLVTNLQFTSTIHVKDFVKMEKQSGFPFHAF